MRAEALKLKILFQARNLKPLDQGKALVILSGMNKMAFKKNISDHISFLTARPGAMIFITISVLVFIFSLVPRFMLIDAWLPHYLIDENDIVEHSIAYLGGDFEPNLYAYGPLYAYLLTLLESIRCGIFQLSYSECAIGIFFEPTNYYLLARITNVAIHLGTAFVTFLIARSVFGLRVALVALPLLVFPFADLLVYFSIRVDSLLALLVSITLFAVIKAYGDLKARWYIIAGIGFGLCVATKPLPALLIIPSLYLAHTLIYLRLIQNKNIEAISFGRSFSRLIISSTTSLYLWLFIATSFITHFIFNPYSILNIKPYYWEHIKLLSSEGSRKFIHGYDITRFFDDFGVLFTILGCISILYLFFYCLYKRNAPIAILTSYPIVFYLAFATGSARDYWYVPVLFLMTIFISKLIVDVIDRLISKKNTKSIEIVITSLIILILIQPTIILIKDSMNRIQGAELHSGLLGKKWIEENIESGSHLLLYGMPLYLPRIVDQRAESQAVFGEYFMRITKDYYVDLFEKAHKEYLATGNPAYLIKNIDSKCHDKEKLAREINDKRFDYIVSSCDIKEDIGDQGVLAVHFPKKTNIYPFELWIYATTQ